MKETFEGCLQYDFRDNLCLNKKRLSDGGLSSEQLDKQLEQYEGKYIRLTVEIIEEINK